MGIALTRSYVFNGIANMKTASELQVQLSRFKDFWTSSKHASLVARERVRTKKRQHPTLKISRIFTAQSWKRNAFAATVVRLPLTTETQILSRSTHTAVPLTRTRKRQTNPCTPVHVSPNNNALTLERVAFRFDWAF